MKKNGFTLVELLVVIAIIAILSVIIVPSVIKVNQTINERMYKQKKDNIVSAAELYASDNPDIFNGAESVYIYVYQLIDANYIDVDVKKGSGNCTPEGSNGLEANAISNGCVTNPSNQNSVMNGDKVLVTKKAVGVTGEYISPGGEKNEDTYANEIRLVDAVCNRFKSGEFLGKYGIQENETCECGYNSEKEKYDKIIRKNDGSTINNGMCMIVSKDASGNVDNWLKYGNATANWRVLGVYSVNGSLYAKMITSDVVE